MNASATTEEYAGLMDAIDAIMRPSGASPWDHTPAEHDVFGMRRPPEWRLKVIRTFPGGLPQLGEIIVTGTGEAQRADFRYGDPGYQHPVYSWLGYRFDTLAKAVVADGWELDTETAETARGAY